MKMLLSWLKYHTTYAHMYDLSGNGMLWRYWIEIVWEGQDITSEGSSSVAEINTTCSPHIHLNAHYCKSNNIQVPSSLNYFADISLNANFLSGTDAIYSGWACEGFRSKWNVNMVSSYQRTKTNLWKWRLNLSVLDVSSWKCAAMEIKRLNLARILRFSAVLQFHTCRSIY